MEIAELSLYLYPNFDKNPAKNKLMRRKLLILSAIAALIALTGCNENKETKGVSFDEVLTSRRSVRSYDASKTISEAEVRELLTATQEAPSWANQQPTKYYVAISDEKLAAVQDLVGGNKDRIKNAPVLIVSTFERGKSGFFQGNQTNEVGDGWGAYDNGLSNCYLIMKARAMGFDTLIMGMRDADALRTLFNIPESETIMAVIALGYRAEEPNRPERRPLDDIVKFF
jgi:nitroreductase